MIIQYSSSTGEKAPAKFQTAKPTRSSHLSYTSPSDPACVAPIRIPTCTLGLPVLLSPTAATSRSPVRRSEPVVATVAVVSAVTTPIQPVEGSRCLALGICRVRPLGKVSANLDVKGTMDRPTRTIVSVGTIPCGKG